MAPHDEANKEEHAPQMEKDSCEEQAKEYLEGWKRERAAFENYKKEEAARAQEMQVWVKRGFFAKLLPMLDSFELALKHTPESMKQEEWFKGYAYIKKQFEEFLRAEGITEIVAQGNAFDPRLHEAIESEGEGDTLTIVEELQKGYRLGDSILRPARVRVGKKGGEKL